MAIVQVPDNTNSLHNIGEYIMEYEPLRNAYITALINRVGMTIITSKLWDNSWSIFKRGRLEFGETVEEIFVNIAKPHSFDPEKAEKEVFKREVPDVRAAFHTMNFQKFYKATISNDQLRQSFLTWGGITDLIARIVDSLYTGMNYDEYVTMKYMVSREILNGGLHQTHADALNKANAEDVIALTRADVLNMGFLSGKYNRAGVKNASNIEDLYVIIDTTKLSVVDVSVLAAAFNMGKAEFLGHIITVDSWEEQDKERLDELFGDDADYRYFTEDELLLLGTVNLVVVDKDWWMVFDNFDTFTQNCNGEGLYWQYWYHVWRTFSVSPFANAIVSTSSNSEINGVTVSPSSANLTQGSMMTFTANVSGTGIYDQAVSWAVAGNTVPGTAIDPYSGALHVARDEPDGTELTVTATAADGTSSGTAIVTVVAA